MPTSIHDIGWKSMISERINDIRFKSMTCQRASMMSGENQWSRVINDIRLKINDMPRSIHDIGWKSMISERSNDIRFKSMICQRASIISDENQWSPRESMISDLNHDMPTSIHDIGWNQWSPRGSMISDLDKWYAKEHPWYRKKIDGWRSMISEGINDIRFK